MFYANGRVENLANSASGTREGFQVQHTEVKKKNEEKLAKA